MRTKLLYWLIGILGFCQQATAQTLGVKTNLLYDATTTPNIGIEASLGGRSSIQAVYGLNPWKFGSDKKIRHWSVMPEYRYWLCRPFGGHFFGVHALGGEYNAGGVKLPFGAFPSLEDHRYEGWYVGGGLTYGYAWMLSRRWNLEAAIGLGFIHTQYDKFECEHCGEKLDSGVKNYVGPTKAAINLVYVF